MLANLLVCVGAGWPDTEIGQGPRFRQGLGAVEIGPDFFPARRQVGWDRQLRLVWIYRCELGGRGGRGVAELATGDKKKQAE